MTATTTDNSNIFAKMGASFDASHLSCLPLQNMPQLWQQMWAQWTKQLAQFPQPDFIHCEKEVVYTENKLQLYHYKPLKKKLNPVPLLVSFAMVNRPYILDLQPDRSLIRALLEAGVDVYLIDWGYPTLEDKDLRLEDYVLKYLNNCVDFVATASKKKAINLLGVCQGGTLSLCYSALFPKKINKLITMISNVDFHTPDNTLTELAKNMEMETITEFYGNMPGWLLNQVLFSLKPTASHWLKYKHAMQETENQEKTANFLRMEHWIWDTPDQAGSAFVQYITQFYQQNLLIKDEIYLDGKQVRLTNITMPVLNIYALKDDIVPASAAKSLKNYIPAENYSEETFAGGHIGIYVSRKAQEEIPPKIAKWLMK